MIAKTNSPSPAQRQVQAGAPETKFLSVGLGGSTVPLQGSGSILFEKPIQVQLASKSAWQRPGLELRLVSDGQQAAVYAPLLNQYQLLERPPVPGPFDLPAPLARQVGPLRILPLYRLLLTGASADRLVDEARNVQYGGTSELDNQSVRLIKWECPATASDEPSPAHRQVQAGAPETKFLSVFPRNAVLSTTD